MADISHRTLSNAFFKMQILEFRLKFHCILSPAGLINKILALIQIMARRRPGDEPSSEPMMVRLPTHICVTQPP